MLCHCVLCFFFFKQKTAYEMRISDWSSDVCSSDLSAEVLYFARAKRVAQQGQRLALFAAYRGCSHPGCRQPATWAEIHHVNAWILGGLTNVDELEIGRASCRERVCQYV